MNLFRHLWPDALEKMRRQLPGIVYYQVASRNDGIGIDIVFKLPCSARQNISTPNGELLLNENEVY
jgi:hypothetical protein